MRKIFFFLLLFVLILPFKSLGGEDELNISYVKSPFNLQLIVMKKLCLLEKELEALGVKVKWHEINSGAQQARAMASGDLDIGAVMNTSSIQMANAEGNSIKIAAGVSRPTELFALVSAKDGVKNIKELKGKIIAGPKGTVLHQLLAAILAKEGLSIDDVHFMQMDPPRAFTALESRQVDAALLAASPLLKAQAAGHHVLTTAEGLVTPKLALAASERFIKKYPDRLQAVLAAHDKAANWIAEHKEEALAIGAEEQGIDLESARQLFARSHFTQRFNQKDLQSMEEDEQFMLENGMMRHKTEASKIVLPQALE